MIIFLHNVYASQVDWQDEERTMAVFTRLAGGHTLCNLTVVTTSVHDGPGMEQESGLLQHLRGYDSVQFFCTNNFEGADLHPGCGSVRTPRQIVEHVVSLALARKDAYSDTDSNSSRTNSIEYQCKTPTNEGPADGCSYIEERPRQQFRDGFLLVSLHYTTTCLLERGS